MTTSLAYANLHEAWTELSAQERMEQFTALPLAARQEFYRELSTRNQLEIITALPDGERMVWLRLLDPDDAADLIQEAPEDERDLLIALLDEHTANDVRALLKYAEDVVGGLMSPRFARVRPNMSVSEALTYVRKQALEQTETVYAIYVLDVDQRLVGVMSLRKLFSSEPQQRVRDIMRNSFVAAPEEADQEELSRLFAEHDLIAIPVIDAEGRMKGIVTIDDIVDVVEEEATEDIQKLGGSEALGAPYLELSLTSMVGKRVGWLTILFLGEMFTTNAMGYFENEIAKAVVLALFVPLIVSSGGNAGSQASTLVIRAMAVGELRLRDWWRVMRRELATGLAMGCILGAIGVARVELGEYFFHSFGPYHWPLALTIGSSLVGIVLWGAVVGSLLPFVLRRVGFDPASASTPFVATLVDVTGMLIYFNAASIILKGTLL